MFSKFIRRNSSTLAPLEAEEEKKKGILGESSKFKSLYLCCVEYADQWPGCSCSSFHRIKHLLASPMHGGDVLKLHEVAYRCGPRSDVHLYMCTGAIGSKIVFFRGIVKQNNGFDPLYAPSKDFSVFETDRSIDPNPKLQPYQVFKIGGPYQVLVEVDDRLYRFGGRNESFKLFDTRYDCESFEIFEPLQDDWLPLAVPPRKYPYPFTHAIAGTKILYWGRHDTGVYMFDVTHPQKGWTELDPSFGSCIPHLHGYDQLFVKHGDGEGFLMFSYKLTPLHEGAYVM